MSRIRVFTGHFGSGKTEIAINYAIKLAKEGRKVAIVDLDIVNPYFCVRDLREELKREYGIRVITSNPDLVNAELMVVPAEVMSVFNDKSYDVVFDVGGDDSGAVALGQFNRFFVQEPYEMYFVINGYRPLTGTNDDTEEFLHEIEAASRLKATYLVSNSNLSYETTEKEVLEGDIKVHELSQKLAIPHIFTACEEELYESLKGKTKGNLFPLHIFMKTPWRKGEFSII